jgi:hypothetical protein
VAAHRAASASAAAAGVADEHRQQIRMELRGALLLGLAMATYVQREVESRVRWQSPAFMQTNVY